MGAVSDQPTAALTTEQLLERLLEVRRAAVDLEERRAADLDVIPVDRRSSGANLLHYVAVRNVDLRVEQQALSLLGLSSLGRAEGHVLATLDAVLRRLAADVGRDLTGEVPDLGLRGPDGDQDILETEADETLGAIPAGRPTRIMVTLPSEAAGDPELVDRFVSSGMTVARVNCAHDGPAAWARMVANVRDASIRHGRAVRVSFDLAGPKLRTGDLEPGPAVLRVRPERDELGRVVTPARLRLVAGRPADLSGEVPEISVDEAVVCSAEPGDEIRLRDARGRKRRLTVTCAIGSAVDATTDRTVYLVPGLKMDLRRGHTTVVDGRVGPLPPTAASIELATGDTLELRRGDGLGRAANADGERARPAFVYVELPDVFDSVLVGERVLIDDGKIEATVTAVGPELISLVIERPVRATLRPEKGINLPATRLHIPPLTADAVAYIAQNPATPSTYAIATFERDIYVTADAGGGWLLREAGAPGLSGHGGASPTCAGTCTTPSASCWRGPTWPPTRRVPRSAWRS